MNIDLFGRVCVNEQEELLNQYYDPASISNASKVQNEEIKRHYNDIPKTFNDLVVRLHLYYKKFQCQILSI